VADDPRPPVAIRITRPYASEEEYLEQELDLLSRTGITLVGAQPRPQGVVLRFELVLSAGQVLLRGEGRVVGFKPSAHQGMGGLTLRFTRIDARSKALLDKAAALRERRRPSNRPVRSEPPPKGDPTPISKIDKPAAPPSQVVPAESTMAPTLADKAAPIQVARVATTEAVTPPLERDALLDKLRARATALDGAAVRRILDQRRRQA
jgi:molecular chaperone DnaK